MEEKQPPYSLLGEESRICPGHHHSRQLPQKDVTCTLSSTPSPFMAQVQPMVDKKLSMSWQCATEAQKADGILGASGPQQK